LAEYYGYIHELAEFLLDLFPPAECVEYMEASDRPRPLVIRTNTLKSSRKDLMEALNKRGASVEAVDWSKVAIKVTESSVPIGATPEYLAGHYMLQSAASLNPVMALAPLPGEKVLDMSAAPGGKTTYIAQLMKNSGTVIANDLKPQRQKATVANLHRLGVKNTVVCTYDGRKIATNMKGFDRVLLDAPCSGLGVISRDQSVKVQRTVKDIQRISHLQKELLRAAVDAVDCKSATGGIIVYSTCSISTEENEQVVDFILKRRYVKLIDTGLEVGKPGFTRHKERRFHPSLALTRRFYPHVHNMDGFYVAKFKKYKNGVRGDTEDEDEEGEDRSEGSDDASDMGSDGEGSFEDEEEEEGSEEEEEESEEESEEEEEPAPVLTKGKAAVKNGATNGKKEIEKVVEKAAPKKEAPAPVVAKKEVVKAAPVVAARAPVVAKAAASKAAAPVVAAVPVVKTPAKTPAKVIAEPEPVAAAPVSNKKQKVAATPATTPAATPKVKKTPKKEVQEVEEVEYDSEDFEDAIEDAIEQTNLKRRRSGASAAGTPGKRKSIQALREVMSAKVRNDAFFCFCCVMLWRGVLLHVCYFPCTPCSRPSPLSTFFLYRRNKVLPA